MLDKSIFAFSPEGEDVASRYLDDGESCGVVGGIDSNDRCWDGLSVLGAVISERYFPTPATGATTTLRFSAGIGLVVISWQGSMLRLLLLPPSLFNLFIFKNYSITE